MADRANLGVYLYKIGVGFLRRVKRREAVVVASGVAVSPLARLPLEQSGAQHVARIRKLGRGHRRVVFGWDALDRSARERSCCETEATNGPTSLTKFLI